MVDSKTNLSKTAVPAVLPRKDGRERDTSPKLQGLDSNIQRAFGPQIWRAFRDTLTHLYTVSLPVPSDEERFTLVSRTYPTPRAILMRTEGTGFTMTRGAAQIALGADQLIIYLGLEGSSEADCSGVRKRIEAGDVAIIDYARPYHSASSDYANLIVHLTRDSLPAALLALEPHGLVFRRGSGAARLISAAMRELFSLADDLTVNEAEAAIDGIVALTTACARARLAGDEADHVKSRRRAALDYIDAHLGNPRLGPGEIAEAANVSRASLYRLLADEGGIRAVLSTRRLDQALRLMLADSKDERSLTDIAKSCGFGGTSQFSRAFRARFNVPPRQYLALVRQQDVEWHEARLIADGFDQDAFLWRQREVNGSK
jgi:AraC-like DNA-binding protein